MYFEHIVMPDPFPIDEPIAIAPRPADLENAPFFDATPDSVAEMDSLAMFDTDKPPRETRQRTDPDLISVQYEPTEVPRFRLEAFQRSPWLWMPSAHQSSFNDQSHVSVNATTMDLITSPENSLGLNAPLSDPLTY